MPDERAEFNRYSNYFSKATPRAMYQAIVLIFFGIFTGIVSLSLIREAVSPAIIIYGMMPGIIIVSIPAFLTISLIKVMRRKINIKHITFATLVGAGSYSLFIILSSLLFITTKNSAIAYVVLLLGNAVVYGYWLLMSKIFIGQKKSAAITAATQPILNILFYLPMSGYILTLGLPLEVLFTKLFAGMTVFLAVIYLFVYLVDKPMKNALNISSVRMFALMVNQWLSPFVTEDYFTNSQFGTKKDVQIDLMLLKKKTGPFKAIFVLPSIHFGPFSGVGGSVATEVLGNHLNRRFNVAPIIMHGAANIADNPVSASQIYSMASHISQHIGQMNKTSFAKASGSFVVGNAKQCSAKSLTINNSRLVVLTKAPGVVEDIDAGVGEKFKQLASANGMQAMIVDAHNSRSEAASMEDLRGVHAQSPYVADYTKAIEKAIQASDKKHELEFGVSYKKLAEPLGFPKDMGKAFATTSLFSFGTKTFCLVYLDANNMLPRFRQEIVKHIEKKFDVECEVCTTDTHEINSLALPASNTLGRHTKIKKLLPLLDSMVEEALSNKEQVQAHSSQITLHHFRIWGEQADAALTKASKDILRIVRNIMPFVFTIGFILAAWIIYIA